MRVQVKKNIRDAEGISRFHQYAFVVRVLCNLDRVMYLVKFSDGKTVFLFEDEFDVISPQKSH